MSDDIYKSLEEKYGRSTLTVKEVANELGVDVDDVDLVIKNGELSYRKIGTKIVIPISSLEKYLSSDLSKDTFDNIKEATLTSNETIELVEDGVDMAKGSITYVKQANLWLYQIDLGKTPDGKRIRKSKSFKTQEEARKALEQELAILNTNVNNKNKKLIMKDDTLMSDYLNYYLSLELGRGGSRTRDCYFYASEHIVKGLGEYKLNELTPEIIIRFLNNLKKKYSQSTLDKVYLVLKMCLKYAVDSEIMSKNPLKNVTKPKSTKIKKDEYKAYSENEILDILTAVRNYYDLYPIILILIFTGMRPGELRALKWENIDFLEKSIYIKAAATIDITNTKIGVKAKTKEIISSTKSAYSVRKLFVPDEVLTALKDWKEYMNTDKSYMKVKNSEYIFPNSNGGFIGDSVLRNRFKKFLVSEGFDGDGFTLYRFRHTYCTTLIKNGVEIPTVQRIMGDNTTDVILKIYTSINTNDIKKASTKAYSNLFS